MIGTKFERSKVALRSRKTYALRTIKKPGSLNSLKGMASYKKLRLENEKKTTRGRAKEKTQEVKKFSAPVFGPAPHSFTRTLAEVCSPPLTQGEVARCLNLNVEGSASRRLWRKDLPESAFGIRKGSALSLLKASLETGRISQDRYIEFYTELCKAKVNIVDRKREIAKMKIVLLKKQS